MAQDYPESGPTTNAGLAILEKDPETGGSLGCAISEAVEKAVTTKDTVMFSALCSTRFYCQSIIGLETKAAMEMLDEYPDIMWVMRRQLEFRQFNRPFMQDKLLGRLPPLSRLSQLLSFVDRGRYL